MRVLGATYVQPFEEKIANKMFKPNLII